MWRQLNTGTIVSGLGHLALILWMLLGSFFGSSEPLMPVAVTEVSLLTAAEFDALSAPEVPQPQLAPPTKPKPQPAPEPEPAPKPEPAPEPQPETKAQPEPLAPPPPAPKPAPVAQQPVPDAAPQPAPRVAPVAAAASDAKVADTVREARAENGTNASATPGPVQEATAPAEASTQIVPEAPKVAPKPASQPQAAPLVAALPKQRPTRPTPDEPKPAQPTAAPVEPPVDTPEPLPALLDMSAINDALAQSMAEAPPVTQPSSPASSQPIGPPLTQGERDSLRVSVQECWNVGALSSDAQRVTVRIGVSLAPNGTPLRETIRLLGFEGGGDAAAKQAFEVGRRAIIRCGATGFPLPAEKYDQWKDVEMEFKPDAMRMR